MDANSRFLRTDDTTAVFGCDETRALPIVTGQDLVRGTLAGVLLVAAALKGQQLATEPVGDTGLLDSRWFMLVLVESELCFALWLLAGRARKLTWCAAVLCFSGFACVSAYKGIAGEVSCGCFGALTVRPWYTFALDIAAVALLLVFPPRTTETGIGRALMLPDWLAVVLALVVGVPGAVAMASLRPGSMSADGQIDGEGSLVVLLPEEWNGKPFPLAEHIDVGQRLSTGQWVLVFYHPGCPECEELIQWFRTSALVDSGSAARQPVAFIEVPESGELTKKLSLPAGVCLFGKLDNSREWFVSTPAILAVKDGMVEEVCRGQRLADFRQLLERRGRQQRSET